jgi:hypothetical protein
MAFEDVKRHEGSAEQFDDLHRKLHKLRAAVEAFEGIREVPLANFRFDRVQPLNFNTVLLKDLIASVTLFAIAVICFLEQVPVLGDSWVLLLGPVLGLVLALMHRPHRQ